MAVLVAGIAAQLAALMVHLHAEGVVFALTGTAIVLGLHYGSKVTHSRTIDQPLPELPTDIEIF